MTTLVVSLLGVATQVGHFSLVVASLLLQRLALHQRRFAARVALNTTAFLTALAALVSASSWMERALLLGAGLALAPVLLRSSAHASPSAGRLNRPERPHCRIGRGLSRGWRSRWAARCREHPALLGALVALLFSGVAWSLPQSAPGASSHDSLARLLLLVPLAGPPTLHAVLSR